MFSKGNYVIVLVENLVCDYVYLFTSGLEFRNKKELRSLKDSMIYSLKCNDFL